MQRKLFMIIPLIVLIGALALTACGAPPSLTRQVPTVEPAQATANPAETPESVTPGVEMMPKTTLSPELQTVAEDATAILSKTLDVSAEDVTILEVQRVEWRDASLGCPQPGMMYAQVITPGYLVKAEVNGEEQMVHMNENGHGVVCPDEQAQPPANFAD